MVIVAIGDVAVNLYHTLYAVPLPQTGAGIAPAAFFKLPVKGLQVNDVVSVPGDAQLAWANIFAGRLITINKKTANSRLLLRLGVGSMVYRI